MDISQGLGVILARMFELHAEDSSASSKFNIQSAQQTIVKIVFIKNINHQKGTQITT